MTASSIGAGQTSSGVISAGDTLTVQYGGTASNVVVQAGGLEIVSGASISDTIGGTVASGSSASQTIANGGLAVGTQVLSGGSATISSGGSTAGSVISGGTETVLSGATIRTPFVAAGGSITLGGKDFGGTVASGGSIDVKGLVYGQAGSALGETVLSGGYIATYDGLISGVVLSGGSALVAGFGRGLAAGTALATQVLSGGVLTVESFGFVSATVISSGGREVLGPDANTEGVVVIAGGTLELTGGSEYGSFAATNQQNGPIVFSASHGVILDRGSEAPSSMISGFDGTDRIILAFVPADPNATLTVAGDMVTVSAAGQSYVMDILGASSIPLTLGIGTMSGTIDIGVACYCAGTAILTPAGEVSVETMAAGDLVVTADGRTESVAWVGRRSYAGRFLAGQPHLLPVRFTAGSLGDGLPRRDLLVSPCHAMLLDGVLVQAGALTNGCTIVQERSAEQVDYVHIELALHDVILAEGSPSETYLDEGNRMMFANAADHNGTDTGGTYCAPRLTDGYQVEAIRRRLGRGQREAA